MPLCGQYLDTKSGMIVRVNARGQVDQINRITTGMWTAVSGYTYEGTTIAINVNGVSYPIDADCIVSASTFVPGT